MNNQLRRARSGIMRYAYMQGLMVWRLALYQDVLEGREKMHTCYLFCIAR